MRSPTACSPSGLVLPDDGDEDLYLIEVQTPLRTTVQEVSGGAGRGNQNSLPPELGLGPAEQVLRVSVRWPSGLVREVGSVAVDPILTVVEGS